MQATSLNALATIEASGSADAMTEMVKDLFTRHGQNGLADFELHALADHDMYTSISARRTELCKDGWLGQYEFTRTNPASGMDAMVWGIVGNTGVLPYSPKDRLEVRLAGKRYNYPLASGEFATMTDEQIGAALRLAVAA